MNLDLIKKLTRLANNNPNDHEANSAARRVCRMLEEGNFNFTTPIDLSGVWVDDSRSSPPPPYTYTAKSKPFWYWEEPDPSGWSEKDFRSHTYGDYHSARGFEFKYKVTHEDWGSKPKREPKEKRVLICNICGIPKETVFVGHPNFFTCQNCVWKKYEEEKNKSKDP